jgi:hypothetical protein
MIAWSNHIYHRQQAWWAHSFRQMIEYKHNTSHSVPLEKRVNVKQSSLVLIRRQNVQISPSQTTQCKSNKLPLHPFNNITCTSLKRDPYKVLAHHGHIKRLESVGIPQLSRNSPYESQHCKSFTHDDVNTRSKTIWPYKETRSHDVISRMWWFYIYQHSIQMHYLHTKPSAFYLFTHLCGTTTNV